MQRLLLVSAADLHQGLLQYAELVRRSIAGFAEMLTIVGRFGEGPDAVVRRPDAIGARIASMGANPWFDAVVVPAGSDPPVDDPLLPYCVWTLAPAMIGRVVRSSSRE